MGTRPAAKGSGMEEPGGDSPGPKWVWHISYLWTLCWLVVVLSYRGRASLGSCLCDVVDVELEVLCPFVTVCYRNICTGTMQVCIV